MGNLPFTLFDAAVLAAIGLSALVGLARGAVAEVLGLASWVGAAVAAFVGAPQLAPMVRQAVGAGGFAEPLTFAGVFLVALVALKLVAGMIARAVSGSALGPVDKALGLAFGAARGAVLVALAYLLASQFVRPEAQPAWVAGARLIGPVRDGSALLARYLPEPDGRGAPAPRGRDAPAPRGPTGAPGGGPGYTAARREAPERAPPPQR